MITQERLKELLHYDPSTGVFTWLVSRGGVSAGSVAGCVNGKGYIQVKLDRTIYEAHRLAFIYVTGEFPPEQADHINQAKLDNRWVNLRPVTHTENQRNSTKCSNNTSGFTGVSWFKRTGQWRASAGVDGKWKHLGLFDCFLDAVAARIRFNRENGFHRNHGAEKGVA